MILKPTVAIVTQNRHYSHASRWIVDSETRSRIGDGVDNEIGGGVDDGIGRGVGGEIGDETGGGVGG